MTVFWSDKNDDVKQTITCQGHKQQHGVGKPAMADNFQFLTVKVFVIV